MDEIFTQDEILAAFREAGVDPLEITNSEVFMSAFNQELTKALMESSRAEADRREADLAAKLDADFRNQMEQLHGHERFTAIQDRRGKLQQAREANAGLSLDAIKTATRNALERTQIQIKGGQYEESQKRLREQYEAEMRAAGRFPTAHTDIRLKYRKLGLKNV